MDFLLKSAHNICNGIHRPIMRITKTINTTIKTTKENSCISINVRSFSLSHSAYARLFFAEEGISFAISTDNQNVKKNCLNEGKNYTFISPFVYQIRVRACLYKIVERVRSLERQYEAFIVDECVHALPLYHTHTYDRIIRLEQTYT